MDDYEPWLTPCDPDFDPEKCESAYALWAVKEEGEPVKFLEASITDNLDYPSGYWFFWRTISFSEETGRLIEGEWGGAGDICRADYVADMVLPGGAVFARVQGELLRRYSIRLEGTPPPGRLREDEGGRGDPRRDPGAAPERIRVDRGNTLTL